MQDLKDKKVCRFCLEQDSEQLKNIFQKQEKCGNIPLQVQVMSCVALEIFEGDQLPPYCCNICKKLLELMYQYKQICKQADTHLKQFMITKKLPDKLNIPLKLIEECLPVKPVQQLVNKETNTEAQKTYYKPNQKIDANPSSSQPKEETNSIASISKQGKAPVTVKQSRGKKTVEKSIPVVFEIEDIVTEPLTKKRRKTQQEHNNEQIIEVVECSQEELERMQNPIITSITYDSQYPKNDHTVKPNPKKGPTLLNKAQKCSMSVETDNIEFKNIIMTDTGSIEVELLELEDTNIDQRNVFPCDYCNRTYPIRQQLDLHLETHFKERNFSCAQCDNKFFTKHDLAKHIVTHTGEKAHK